MWLYFNDYISRSNYSMVGYFPDTLNWSWKEHIWHRDKQSSLRGHTDNQEHTFNFYLFAVCVYLHIYSKMGGH